MVALSYIVSHVVEVIERVHIAHKTLLLTAMRTGELPLRTPCQLAGL